MATERDDRSNMPGEIGQNSRRRSREGDIGRTNGNGDVPRPFLIAVAGGTASGKSTVCDKIMDQLGQHDVDHRQRQVVTISQDSFYRSLTDEERLQADKGAYNFDHPAAFDDQLLLTTVKDIKEGKIIEIPEYDMKAHRRMEDNLKTVHAGTDVVIFEGILMLYFKEVRDLFNMKLFVDTDADTRLSRRVMRDVQERHRNLEKVLYQYTTFVKPAFEEFCLPTKKHADVIIPRGADNTVAIDLLVQHIQDLLKPNGHRRTGAANTRRTRTTSDSLVSRPH